MASGVNFGTQQYFGFDPRTIPGCALWLDAADSATVVTSGNVVTQWKDKSGLGNTTTVIGGSPTYSSNQINLNGSSTYLAGPYANTTTTLTAFVVATVNFSLGDYGAFYRLLSVGSTAANDYNNVAYAAAILHQPNSTNIGGYRNGAQNYVSVTTNTPFLLVQQYNGSTAQLYLNGTTSASTGSSGSFSTSSYSIGRDVGNTDGTPPVYAYAYWPGSIREVLLFNGSLTQLERQQVEGYLVWKWALTSNLPTTHPFRPVPPVMRAFLPVDVSGALLWLDAADATTITGSPVTQWTDKSGRGSNATTGSGSVVAGTALNSLNTLRFGSNITLNLSNFVMPSAQTSVFYVFRGITNSASGGTGYFIFSRTLDNFMVFSGNEQFFAYQSPAQARSYVAVMGPGGERNWGNLPVPAFSNATSVVSTTGVSYASSNGLSLALVATSNVSNTVATASTYQISTTRSVGDVNTYDLGELIVYDGTLSVPTAQQLEGYLAWKWGVPRSLPTTHPYYNALPSTPLFNPAQLSGLTLWLDAADRTTLTLSGSSVTAWNDKSGNGRNATGVVAPTYDGTTRYILFNGSSQYFTLPNDTFPTGNTPYSMFFVAYTNNAANPQWIIAGGTESTNQAIGAIFYFTNAIWHSWWGNEYRVDNSISNGVPAILNLSYSTTRTTIVNGGTATTNTPGASRGNSSGPNFIGRRVSSVEYLNGGIGEIVIFSSEIPTFQRQEVEGYLAWKWGLQASLPSTHPFAKVRP